MCPDYSAIHLKKQQGSALIIAIFIIVVMTLLVGALSRLLSSSSENTIYEVLGTRAFFAAQSGIEQGLAQLFPVSANSTYCEIGVDGRSPAVNPPDALNIRVNSGLAGIAEEQTQGFNNIAGLQGCSYTLNCTSGRKVDDDSAVRYYQLISTGYCKAGAVESQRTLEIEVWQ